LDHAAWQQHFGGRPGIVGEAIELDGTPHVVVGVMPAEFGAPVPLDAWILARQDVPEAPFPGDEDYEHDRDVHYLGVVARLAPGVERESAGAEARTIAARLERAYPGSNRGRSARVISLHEDVVGDVRAALVTLLAAVGVVLAVVAVNIASLLVARGAARQREISIRAAMGAPRSRIVRQLLAESVVLGLAGGVAGFTLALWTLDLLVAIGPGDVPRLTDARIDVRVFAFSGSLSLAVAVAFGLLPAVQASRADLVSVFRQGIGGGRSRQRLRAVLVGVELAAAVVLLVVAGLVGRSFMELRRVDLGYDVDRVYTMGLPLPEGRYSSEEQQAVFFERLLPEIDAVPGIDSVAAVFPRPLSGAEGSADFEIEGRPARPEDRNLAGVNWITPDFFRVMRIRVIRGRAFTDRDRSGAPLVVVINQRAAERFWPGESPVGRRIRLSLDATAPLHEVIGVVGDTRAYGLGRAPEPALYLPHAQGALPFMSLVIRASGDRSSLLGAVRERVAALDPGLPAGDLTPMVRAVHEQLAPARFRTILLGGFSGAALLLGAIGIYGSISYMVAQRTAEIGLRLALGATRSQVRRLVMRHGLTLAAAGLGAGLVLALVSTAWLSSLLFEIQPLDPVTLAAVVALLLGVALAACYLPARHATRIDPATALRTE
jgi:putative ABC transport system permease protein